jgi:hypothetical protein
MERVKIGLVALVMATFLSACATTSGTTPQEKRQAVNAMRNDVLSELYQLRPQARREIAAAPGYAVFSNANINIIFASFSGGYGVVTDKPGKQTFMKMGEAGIGLGLGRTFVQSSSFISAPTWTTSSAVAGSLEAMPMPRPRPATKALPWVAKRFSTESLSIS